MVIIQFATLNNQSRYIYILPSGKQPMSSGNQSSNPDDCQGRHVNLLEGNHLIKKPSISISH